MCRSAGPQFWLNLQAVYELHLAEQKTGGAIKTLPTLSARAKKSAAKELHPA